MRFSCIKNIFFSPFLVVLVSFTTVNANPVEETIQRLYPIPEHGELILEVPARWEVTYFSPAENKPPVITFYQIDEQDNELFQLNLSPLWDDGFKRNITTPENIRNLVEEVGESILAMSDENELNLKPLKSTDGEGYFFSLTDSKASPGEYMYLTQGAFNVGEILVVFSLFTHEPDSVIYEMTLKMLQTALHRFQRHV